MDKVNRERKGRQTYGIALILVPVERLYEKEHKHAHSKL